MRWRLLRRRLSVSAPRMAVRSHLPWPLRWAAVALVLGFSGALAFWAFEFGRELAGLDGGGRQATAQLAEARAQLDAVRRDRDRAQSIANTADSLLRAERVTQARLLEQVKALEAENEALKADLGFFERLLPASSSGVAIRGAQVEPLGGGQWRYQLLIMQPGGRQALEFVGRLSVQPGGTKDGQPWAPEAAPPQPEALRLRQHRRLEGVFSVPAGVQLRQVQFRVMDASGVVRATQVVRL